MWGDLLTKYNGLTVTSDEIGNMTAYNGQSWSWKGRQLDSYTNASGTKTSYSYNADGIRTKKTTGSKTTEYFLNGDQILMMKTTDGTTEDIIWFFYDSQGQRIGLCRNGTYMYYLYNVQGDVTAIVSAGTGQIVATYTYDTWGNCTVKEHSGYAIGDLNPFRYRGYYWDEESGMYYLNSRYYSSEFGRFISADSETTLLANPTGISDKNLFAYCNNNPVNRSDDGGAFWHIVVGALVGAAVSGLAKVISNVADGARGKDALSGVGGALLTGAASGALGATGIGVIGLAVGNAAISAGASIIEQSASNSSIGDVNVGEVAFDAVVGGAFGAVGGGGSGDDYLRYLGKQTRKRFSNELTHQGFAAGIKEGKKAMVYYGKMTKKYYKDTYGGWKTPVAVVTSIFNDALTSDYMKGQYAQLTRR